MPHRASSPSPPQAAAEPPVALSPRGPQGREAWLVLAPCPGALCSHLDGLEPVQEGVHPPKDLRRGKLPELFLLLGGERGCQPGPGVQGQSSCTVPAPTGKNVVVSSEQ